MWWKEELPTIALQLTRLQQDSASTMCSAQDRSWAAFSPLGGLRLPESGSTLRTSANQFLQRTPCLSQTRRLHPGS